VSVLAWWVLGGGALFLLALFVVRWLDGPDEPERGELIEFAPRSSRTGRPVPPAPPARGGVPPELRAEITRTLLEAGATEGALSHWWRCAHTELNGFSPRHALQLDPGCAGLVLELARSDAADLRDAAGMRIPAAVTPTTKTRSRGGPRPCLVPPES
jgi:hypothetical protein